MRLVKRVEKHRGEKAGRAHNTARRGEGNCPGVTTAGWGPGERAVSCELSPLVSFFIGGKLSSEQARTAHENASYVEQGLRDSGKVCAAPGNPNCILLTPEYPLLLL